jgi:hypothetical protein
VGTEGGYPGSTQPRRLSPTTLKPTAWRETPSRAFRQPAVPRGQMFFGSKSGLTSFGRIRSSESHSSRPSS